METTATQMIEVLIRDYSKLVFHVIYGLTGHWEESQDLTQETFLQAFRGIEAARAKAGPHFQAKAWLLRIAVNTTRMSRRRRAIRFFSFSELQQERGPDELNGEVPTVASQESAETIDLETTIAERDTIRRCIEQLPDTLRFPLVLSIVGGFSPQEIAQMLAINEAAVRQRLSRARKGFQRLYQEAGGEFLLLGEPASAETKGISRPRNHLLHQTGSAVL